MRTLNKPMRTTAFTAFLLLASAALAQPAPDWRAVLVDLYSIDTAFDACKAITPSASDLLRLEAAIAHVEEKSGLGEDELDALYDSVENEAGQLTEFCQRMADAVARVRNIPPDYR
jgi:hypothetical protein